MQSQNQFIAKTLVVEMIPRSLHKVAIIDAAREFVHDENKLEKVWVDFKGGFAFVSYEDKESSADAQENNNLQTLLREQAAEITVRPIDVVRNEGVCLFFKNNTKCNCTNSNKFRHPAKYLPKNRKDDRKAKL